LFFARNIDWQLSKRLEVKITDFQSPHFARLKGGKLLAFDLEFQSNVFYLIIWVLAKAQVLALVQKRK